MSEIKPRMVDGEAVCSRLCPRTSFSQCIHVTKPTALKASTCWPYYRARVAALEQRIERVREQRDEARRVSTMWHDENRAKAKEIDRICVTIEGLQRFDMHSDGCSSEQCGCHFEPDETGEWLWYDDVIVALSGTPDDPTPAPAKCPTCERVREYCGPPNNGPYHEGRPWADDIMRILTDTAGGD